MHIDVNSYQLMLGYTYEILHINGATSPKNLDNIFLVSQFLKCKGKHLFLSPVMCCVLPLPRQRLSPHPYLRLIQGKSF